MKTKFTWKPCGNWKRIKNLFVFVFVYLIAAHAVAEGETHAGTGFLAHGIDTLP